MDAKITKDPAEKSKQNGFGFKIKKEANGMEIIIKMSPEMNSIIKTPQFLFDSSLNHTIAYLNLEPATIEPSKVSASPKNCIIDNPNLIKYLNI